MALLRQFGFLGQLDEDVGQSIRMAPDAINLVVRKPFGLLPEKLPADVDGNQVVLTIEAN